MQSRTIFPDRLLRFDPSITTTNTAHIYTISTICSLKILAVDSDTRSIARALGEDYALDDGQIYRFDIRTVRYISASDHYDPNHYDYYVPYTGSFLVGERRALELSRDDDIDRISVDRRMLTSNVDAARDSAFDDFCQSLKEAPWLRFRERRKCLP